jgi:hypothetical protein
MVHTLLLSCVLGAPSNHLLVQPSWLKYSIVRVVPAANSPIVTAKRRVVEVPVTANVLPLPELPLTPVPEPPDSWVNQGGDCRKGQCPLSPPSAVQSASDCANGQCPVQGGGRFLRRFR